MTDDIKNKLMSNSAELIDYVTQWAKDGDVLVREQAPLVAKEILNYAIASHGAGILLSLVIAGATIYFSRDFWKRQKENAYADWSIASVAIGAIGGLISFMIFIVNAASIVQPIVAPRLYILQTMREIFK